NAAQELVGSVRSLLRGLLARPLASYYLLVSSAGLLLIIGLAMVFSATSVKQFVASGNAFTSIQRQGISAVVGLLAFWMCQRLPVRTYRALAKPGLIVAFSLIIALDVLGVLAQANVLSEPTFGPVHADLLWLYLGPLQLQPSELAKMALAIWVADVLVRKGSEAGAWSELSRPLFPVAGLLFVLVGLNDLGTMLCLVVLFVGMLWADGVRLRVFAGMFAVALAGVMALIYLPGRSSYRHGRLDAFLHPELNQLGDGYQVREGLFAIANGGWFGVGLGEGRLKWGWLPNGHNDFIFAVIAEELGVMGCLVVLGLFGVLAYTGLRIARRVTNPFRRLVAAGVTALIAGQATINIGGVVGLMPVTGLPLPLISDGGSALVVTLAMIGMLASFARAEPEAARALHARPPGRLARLLWAPLPPMPVRRGSAASREWERGSDDG
ncbi:MAG: cell division protein FtsW, partial [Micromonosporaceae bacterium]|nr:cell division protein FtsW [Micromonosporaceae bacterium]